MHSNDSGFKTFVNMVFVDRTICCASVASDSFHLGLGDFVRVRSTNEIAQLSAASGRITRVQHYVQRHQGIYTYRLYVWTDALIWKTEILRVDGNESGYSLEVG